MHEKESTFLGFSLLENRTYWPLIIAMADVGAGGRGGTCGSQKYVLKPEIALGGMIIRVGI